MNNPTMKQTVRIIGGCYRGKKLHVPNLPGLRPTPDRVRETLFNWLMHDIRGSRCLDAFAGSGALGFEALSRGASHVVLLEQSLQAFHHLNLAAKSFDNEQLHIIHTDAYHYIQHSKEQFDLVFLDPPYAEESLRKNCLDLLASSTRLAPNGLVFVESAHPLSLDSTYWQTLKLKTAGQVVYGLYRKNEILIENRSAIPALF